MPREADPAPGRLDGDRARPRPLLDPVPDLLDHDGLFKTERSLYARPPQWLFFTPVLENYRWVLGNIPFVEYLTNSLVIAIGTTVGSLVLGILAGYGFARFRFPGSDAVRFMVLVTRMAPRIVLVVPYYLMMQRLGLLDTYTGLLIAYVSFALPFTIWLLIGFFMDVPREIEEAAMIDGYSRLGAFFRVVVPISLAGILTVAIFSFTLVMQEFVYAVTFISSSRNLTVGVGVPTFLVHGDVYFWGSLMAGCFIASVPVAILYNFFVDRFIAGFTVGAIK